MSHFGAPDLPRWFLFTHCIFPPSGRWASADYLQGLFGVRLVYAVLLTFGLSVLFFYLAFQLTEIKQANILAIVKALETPTTDIETEMKRIKESYTSKYDLYVPLLLCYSSTPISFLFYLINYFTIFQIGPLVMKMNPISGLMQLPSKMFAKWGVTT